MSNTVFEFLKRHSSLILTTHDPADADGLGAELVMSMVARHLGKKVRIVNSCQIPGNIRFMDRENAVEIWDQAQPLPPEAALDILDTTDEYHIGKLREFVTKTAEVFVIDHHEPNKFCTFKGYIDNTASSICELTIELAKKAGVKLTPQCAAAAYAGLVYDSGYFAYSKTTQRTFKAALSLVKSGVKPYAVYQELNENESTEVLLLQKQVLSTLEIGNQGQVATQILRKVDLETCGARIEDAEQFVNIPLKSRTIEVSVLVKENKEGQIRCSLRSKGRVNVSQIAQSLGGGGHVSAAGFISTLGPEATLAMVLDKITEAMENTQNKSDSKKLESKK